MSEAAESKETIQYDDFVKLDLKIGTVKEVSDHPNADKLLVMQVDMGGGETRQILAGIKGYCTHEQILGSQIVIVANLAPRKMRGLESQGMLLAASWLEGEGEEEIRKVVPISCPVKAPAGSSIS